MSQIEKPNFPVALWATWSLVVILAAAAVYRYADPAPPKHFVIAAGDVEGNYQEYAKLYQEFMKDEGVTLEIRQTSGAVENLKLLEDPNSNVQAAFAQDGLGNVEEGPDVSSLGSLYYEPVWVFYKGNTISRFSQLKGKRIAIGRVGGGTRILVMNILMAFGIHEKNSLLTEDAWIDAANALRRNKVNAIVLIGTPDEPLIHELILDPNIRLMSVDQAEAITRQIPYLHHLILPHGTIDLLKNLPAQDIDMIAPTATLLVKDSLHPALSYLLLKAASDIHGEAGIFEKKGEFPIDKDYAFPLSDDAKGFYKSGTPFWHRYLPFWLATLVQRFILLVIPAIAIVLPILRLIPRFRQWRIRSRIYKRYGELKFLELQIKPHSTTEKVHEYLRHLDRIENEVKHMRVPLEYTEDLYGLRGHIDFVREQIRTSELHSSVHKGH